MLPHDAEHIATFDPPTVIELIEQVEYYKRKNETLSALGKANHDWNMKNRADLTTRLEQAEQTVARVKEIASEYRETIPEEVLHSVMKTLNGESNE